MLDKSENMFYHIIILIHRLQPCGTSHVRLVIFVGFSGGVILDKETGNEKNEKLEKVKKMLKDWGKGSIWVRNKSAEYTFINDLYERGRKSELVPEAALFSYRSLAEQVFRDVREYLYDKAKVEEMLESLDTLERCIIVCRYAKGVKWDSVPAHLPMGVSIRQCYRIHEQALEKLAKLMEEQNWEESASDKQEKTEQQG